MDTSKPLIQRSNKNKLNSKVVIFVHGLGANPGYFKEILKYKPLQKFNIFFSDFKDGVTKESIEYQSELLLQELYAKLKYWKKDKYDLVFVGHSLGGLISLSTIYKFFLKQDEFPFEIQPRGLVSIGSPWNGVSLINYAIEKHIIKNPYDSLIEMKVDSQHRSKIIEILKYIDELNLYTDKKFTILPIATHLNTLTLYKIRFLIYMATLFQKFTRNKSINSSLNNQDLKYLYSYYKDKKHDLILSIENQMGLGTIPTSLLIKKSGVILKGLKHDKIENIFKSEENSAKSLNFAKKILQNITKSDLPQLESKELIDIIVNYIHQI